METVPEKTASHDLCCSRADKSRALRQQIDEQIGALAEAVDAVRASDEFPRGFRCVSV